VATIATTPVELAQASGSFYNQTMALAELDLSRYQLGPTRGSPSWARRVRSRHPGHAGAPLATGAHRIDAVVLTIALLCTKSFDYEG